MLSFLEHIGSFTRRKKPWDKVVTSGLPNKSWEHYSYVPLDSLYEERFSSPTKPKVTEQEIKKALLPECEGSFLVFINGVFCKELSCHSQLMVLPLSEAEVKFAAFLKERQEREVFSLLNAALFEEGAFLYLPPKTVMETPLQILHFYQGSALFSPRVHLVLGKESRLNLYTTEINLGGVKKSWTNGFFDIVLEERAELFFVSLSEKVETYHTEALQVDVKKGAHFKFISAGFGKKLFRQDIQLTVHKGATGSLGGVFLLDKKREAHIHTHVDHKEEAAHSLQKFKGILNDQSRLSFEGKIFVRDKALKTEAYQLNNNLLLSDLARAYSKPNLEIFADDVKASHGATIGRLNSEDLFYLKAKGLPEAIAKRLLIEGFYKEVLEEIPLKTVKERIRIDAPL